jgi:serine/threonine-protein kinase ATR
MQASERYNRNEITREYAHVAKIRSKCVWVQVPHLNVISSQCSWEAVYFHWGLYLDRSLTRKSVQEIEAKEFELCVHVNLCDYSTLTIRRYVNHVNVVVRQYGSSLLNGSKYLYQTLPRMLTLWLDLGERAELSPKTG